MSVRRIAESFDGFIAQFKAFQTSLRAAMASDSLSEINRVLHKLDEMQVFWFVPQPNASIFRVDFAHMADDDLAVQPQRREGLRDTIRSSPIVTESGGPGFFSALAKIQLRSQVGKGTFPWRTAFISMSENTAVAAAIVNPYDQYEVRCRPANVLVSTFQLAARSSCLL